MPGAAGAASVHPLPASAALPTGNAFTVLPGFTASGNEYTARGASVIASAYAHRGSPSYLASRTATRYSPSFGAVNVSTGSAK